MQCPPALARGPSLTCQPFLRRSAVVGHFDHPHGRPWKDIDQKVTAGLASIVGAEEAEVACTSTLTSNLHNLFVSFYRPEKGKGAKRRKILVEGKAFPSDQVRLALAQPANRRATDSWPGFLHSTLFSRTSTYTG